MKGMPKTVTIRGRLWRLEWIDGLVGEYGYCDAGTQTIKIDRETKSPQLIAEVIVHELLHAAWFQAGLPRSEGSMVEEETVVTALAPPLVDLLVENPNLLTFLRKLWASTDGT